MVTILFSVVVFLTTALNDLNTAQTVLPEMIPESEITVMHSDESLPAEAITYSESEPQTTTDALYPGQLLKVPQDNASVVVSSGRAGLNKVALTFDSGWIFEPTETILQVLAENDVRATFFMRGGWAEAYPDLVQQIKDGGHEIGNHSYSHDHLPLLTAAEVHQELGGTREILSQLVGQTQDYYRPPYGEYNDRDVEIAGKEDYRFVVMWSIDSIDWMEPGEAEILQRVGHELEDGGIALMHVGVWQTANILPEVIAALRSRGLEPVPLSELLDWSALPMQEISVEEGDTIESIAKQYRLNPSILKWINGIDE